jgi:hypothetical protein
MVASSWRALAFSIFMECLNSVPPKKMDGCCYGEMNRKQAAPNGVQAKRGGWSIEGGNPSIKIGSQVKKIMGVTLRTVSLLETKATIIFKTFPHRAQANGAPSS